MTETNELLKQERWTPEQLLFLSNFIKETATFVEELEGYKGEYHDEFWGDRELAYHLITDALIDTLRQSASLKGENAEVKQA